NALWSVEAPSREPGVALDDIAGDQRVLEIERGHMALGRQHAEPQSIGAIIATLAGSRLGPRVVDDRWQVNGADVGRPVDAARVDVERGRIFGRQSVVDRHEIVRLADGLALCVET